MDLHSLHAALSSTLSQQQAEREAAETALKGFQSAPGYLAALFTVVSSAEAKSEVRQAGAIYFKNLVLKQWGNQAGTDTSDGDTVIFPEEEKDTVRGLLLDSLMSATHQTRYVFSFILSQSSAGAHICASLLLDILWRPLLVSAGMTGETLRRNRVGSRTCSVRLQAVAEHMHH